MNEYLATILLEEDTLEETFTAKDGDDAYRQARDLFPECLEIDI